VEPLGSLEAETINDLTDEFAAYEALPSPPGTPIEARVDGGEAELQRTDRAPVGGIVLWLPPALVRVVPGLVSTGALAALGVLLLRGPYAAAAHWILSVVVSVLLAVLASATVIPLFGTWVSRNRRQEEGSSGEEVGLAVPSLILIVLVIGLLWLVWDRPGLWDAGLVIAGAIGCVAGIGARRRGRRRDLSVGDAVRRQLSGSGVIARTQLRWLLLPLPARSSVLLLIALNTVIAAAILPGNTTPFVAMAIIDFAVLLRVIDPPRAADTPPSSGAALPVASHDAAIAADRPVTSPRRNGAASAAPRTIAAPGLDHGVRTWDVPAREPEETGIAADKAVVSRRPKRVAIAADRFVVARGLDRGIRSWDVPVAEPEETVSVAEPQETVAEGEPEEATASSAAGRLERFRPRAAVCALVVALGWIAYTHPGPLLIPGVLVLGLAFAFATDADWDRTVRMVFGIGVAVTSVDYVSWRIVVTNWQGWWIAVPLLCAETLGAVHVLGFQFTLWPWSPPQFHEGEDPTHHPIFILIPTLNEGPAVLRPTVEACLSARDRFLAEHPHGAVEIVICNDGRAAGVEGWRQVDKLAKNLGVTCISRCRGGGAKAGNIEHARQQLRIEGRAFLVIFDADQVPKADFLVQTIRPFSDPSVGWVQTGQYYGNLGNPVARWADDQQSMFYNLLCPGKARQNAAFICGTNVVIRAEALDEIGGLPQNSVTEDFAASIVLHPRWRSVYLSAVLATGLGPLDVPSYLKQQRRWAFGTLDVLRTHWRDIFLPNRQGLQPMQRVQYFLACTHYLSGLRDLIYMVCPMLFIVTGVPAVRSGSLTQYLWHFVPYGLLSFGALWYSARGVTGLRGIVIGFGSFPTLVGSLVAVLTRRSVSFAVTSKRRRASQSLRYLNVYLAAALLCVASLVLATQVTGHQKTSLFISVMWVSYSLLMLGGFLWLAFRDLRFHRVILPSGVADDMAPKPPYPSKLLRRPRGLRPLGALAVAALVASPILLGDQLKAAAIFPGHGRAPVVAAATEVKAPNVGVSLPAPLLLTQARPLETALRANFTIIGRTQDISDNFGASWAAGLAAQGARPWITLQFGEFGPGQRAPLSAGLPAIVNGVDDAAIARWAREIRSFGQPVYLTILLQVDKNWSVSSGVANGGIPEDVPKAWLHVQAIFRSVGAKNVAWVWAPADPMHDQQFAPPPSSIDAVLQTFVNYPGTTWGDPVAVLGALTRRYPDKPLFVEVSAAGPPAEKAAWLRTLGTAVTEYTHIRSLLYHEGGPGLNPSQGQITQWSLESDPASLAAWRQVLNEFKAARRLA
jgi:cellulose synthase (UDP-forming)